MVGTHMHVRSYSIKRRGMRGDCNGLVVNGDKQEVLANNPGTLPAERCYQYLVLEHRDSIACNAEAKLHSVVVSSCE